MSPRSSSSSPPLLLLLLLLFSEVWSYEAPVEKEDDVFEVTACPAFLSFVNAAYLRGVTVELPCSCKPTQVQSVVWFYKKHPRSSEETIVLTDHHGNQVLDNKRVSQRSNLQSRFSIRLFNLMIFRAALNDSGIYICGSDHKDFFYAYDLDIQDTHTFSFNTSPSRGRAWTRRRSAAPQALFRLFTNYQRWSVCDRCGVPGEQIRIGLCYIQSKYLYVRYRQVNQTVASCGSEAVPRDFGLWKQGRGGAKMLIRKCQVTCPPAPPPPSRLDGLLWFLGLSSAPKGAMSVFYLTRPEDRVLTLGCPGARPNLAVAWDRGSEPLHRSKHMRGRNGSRLQIDTAHHLVLRPAKPQDSGVYYCWLQGRRVAEIHLLVYARLGRGQSVTLDPNFYSALRTVVQSYVAMTTMFCLLLCVRLGYRLCSDTGHTD
ncbi:Ig-like V-type domain-containing protein FAM187A [Genypterus blacodes]|uniref:Ig-like V-type domain-containing protein FAM187A n=1 Tax=Genypterus blacodes TaxID=154954 RepID=UPI003F76EBFD